jgi:hypothetical protein
MTRVHTQRLGGLFPEQLCALMDEGHEGEGDQVVGVFGVLAEVDLRPLVVSHKQSFCTAQVDAIKAFKI